LRSATSKSGRRLRDPCPSPLLPRHAFLSMSPRRRTSRLRPCRPVWPRWVLVESSRRLRAPSTSPVISYGRPSTPSRRTALLPSGKCRILSSSGTPLRSSWRARVPRGCRITGKPTTLWPRW
jgi:hypothetical protein